MCPTIIGANLSKPHINGLHGAGCYGVACVRSYVNFGLRAVGGHIYLHLSTSRVPYGLGQSGCPARECFQFSLWSTSNDLEQNHSSSPILPTINDRCCAIGNLPQLYGLCTAVLGHTSKGLAEAWQLGANCLCVHAQWA